MEELIELVKQYEVLYVPKCKKYKNQSYRTAIWAEIGEKLNQAPEKCKDDWTKLRNAYINALKRRKIKQSEPTAAPLAPWKYEEQLSFLKPHMVSRPSTTINLTLQPEAPEITHIKVESNQSENSESPPATPNSYCSSNSQKYCRNEANVQDLKNYLMKSSDDLGPQGLSAHNDMDETDLFFMSMSKTVKGLPKLEQIKIKLDLRTLLFRKRKYVKFRNEIKCQNRKKREQIRSY